MDDNIPLIKVLGHVGNKWVMPMNKHASVNSVPSLPVKNTPRSLSRNNSLSRSSSQSSVNLQSNRSNPTKFEDTLSKITAKLNQLQQLMNQTSVTRTPSPCKFCAFCQTEAHFLRDCWRKPEKGHCFDCLKFGSKWGNPTCPGNVARTTSAPMNSGEKTSHSQMNSSSVRTTNASVENTNASVTDPTL